MSGLAFVVLMGSCLFVFVFLVELFRVSEVENECRRLRYRNALLDNQLTDINGKIDLLRADVDHLANTVDYLSTPDEKPVVVEDIPVMPKQLKAEDSGCSVTLADIHSEPMACNNCGCTDWKCDECGAMSRAY